MSIQSWLAHMSANLSRALFWRVQEAFFKSATQERPGVVPVPVKDEVVDPVVGGGVDLAGHHAAGRPRPRSPRAGPSAARGRGSARRALADEFPFCPACAVHGFVGGIDVVVGEIINADLVGRRRGGGHGCPPCKAGRAGRQPRKPGLSLDRAVATCCASPATMRSLLPLLLLMTLPALSPASGQSLVVEKPEFGQLVPKDATVEKLAGGFKFVEGPAWNSARRYPDLQRHPGRQNVPLRSPARGQARVFRVRPAITPTAISTMLPGNDSLYTCEHGSRSVTPWNEAKRWRRSPANSRANASTHPTMSWSRSDGTVWFTDPTYGLGKQPKEQATNNVYCLDPKTGDLRAVATDFVQPNGLCFSPDEKLLYIADSGNPPQLVRVFDVTADNRLANGRLFCQIDKGVPDGMRCDRHGNLFSSAGRRRPDLRARRHAPGENPRARDAGQPVLRRPGSGTNSSSRRGRRSTTSS